MRSFFITELCGHLSLWQNLERANGEMVVTGWLQSLDYTTERITVTIAVEVFSWMTRQDTVHTSISCQRCGKIVLYWLSDRITENRLYLILILGHILDDVSTCSFRRLTDLEIHTP